MSSSWGWKSTGDNNIVRKTEDGLQPSSSGGGGGITQINGNSTAHQVIAAGTGISVGSSGGTTTITNSAPFTAAITQINGDSTAHQVFSSTNPYCTFVNNSAGATSLHIATQGYNTNGIVQCQQAFSNSGDMIFFNGNGSPPDVCDVLFYPGADGYLIMSQGGSPTWLAPGTNGQVLTMVSGVPTWV